TTASETRGPVVLAIAVAALAVVLAIFALGRSLASPVQPTVGTAAAASDGDVASAPASAEVELAEFAITPATLEVAHGGRLTVTNIGAAEHNLEVRDTDTRTADLAPGDTATLDLAALEPGTYAVWCDIPGHAAGGMTGTLTVTGSAGEHTAEHGGGAPTAHADAAGAVDVEAMKATMKASIEAFPAATEGLGAQIMEPTILADGTKEYVLVADEIEWEVEPGRIVDAVAYNGQIPGPTIDVEVGDRVRVVVENRLEEITTLHPHGVRQHPFDVDGVGYVSQDPIDPGDSFAYEFVAQEQSVGMYHGHDMGLHQVVNGLAGAFLVGDVPVPDGVDTSGGEHVMMLNDAGNIGFSLNGKSFPATAPYRLEEGQGMVVHYMNEGLAPHPMHLHNNRQLVIAKDGFPLESPYYADTINVAPGERYTVAIEAELPGVWVWHCHILPHVEKSDGTMFGMLTALIVE
ncbi:MAG: multicopper oxidase domain-containing protein, partial [Actinobacteria bacterium]|nr:multicopper oxidase domain-containing protein [Actinomycetota bacterium]